MVVLNSQQWIKSTAQCILQSTPFPPPESEYLKRSVSVMAICWDHKKLHCLIIKIEVMVLNNNVCLLCSVKEDK